MITPAPPPNHLRLRLQVESICTAMLRNLAESQLWASGPQAELPYLFSSASTRHGLATTHRTGVVLLRLLLLYSYLDLSGFVIELRPCGSLQDCLPQLICRRRVSIEGKVVPGTEEVENVAQCGSVSFRRPVVAMCLRVTQYPRQVGGWSIIYIERKLGSITN